MALEKIFLFANHKQELRIAATTDAWLARNIDILFRISHTSFQQSNNSFSEQNMF